MACAVDEIRNKTKPVIKDNRESFNPAFPKNDFWNGHKKKTRCAHPKRKDKMLNWINRDEIIRRLFPVSADKIFMFKVYQMNDIFGEKG